MDPLSTTVSPDMVAARPMGYRGVGWAIRKVRQGQDRTLDDVADAIGSDAGNLSRVERGEQWPPEAQLNAVALELGLNASDLLRLAERGENDLAGLMAIVGQLPPSKRAELQRYAEFLLTQI